MIDPEKKASFNLYLQSRPAQAESRMIKECMINQKLANKYIVDRMMTSLSLLSLNESQRSRDTQLDFYAKAIENIKE